MFFYDDKPHKGAAQDDTSDDFIDLIEHARLMAWLCLVAFVGFVAWKVLL